MLEFILNAWGPFTLPIASICNANDWAREWLAACVFSMRLCPFSLSTNFCLPISSDQKLCRRNTWSRIKSCGRQRRTCGSAVWRLRSTSLVVNVIWKAVYNMSLQLLHRMSTVQAVAVQFPLMGLQLWESFFHFLTWFPFTITHLLVKSKITPTALQLYGNPQDLFHLEKNSLSI